MPHKRNPFRSMEIATNAKLLRGYAETMMSALELEHERDPRSASVEHVLLQRACSTVHASVERAINLVNHLVVYPDNMMRNLEASPWLENPQLVEVKAVVLNGRRSNEFAMNFMLTRAQPIQPPAGKGKK